MIFTLGERNEDFTTGKRNISRPRLSKRDHASAIADHVKTTGHNIQWDHFDILASGKNDYRCKVKKTLFIQECQPALNVNVNISTADMFSVLVPDPHLYSINSFSKNFNGHIFENVC